MKKFKVADIIEAPWTAGFSLMAGQGSAPFRYEVTRQDEDGEWRGRYIGPGPMNGAEAHLGRDPKKYRLIERPSIKKRQIENLTKALAESQREAAELNQAAAGAMAEKELLERQIEVDAWARDEVMFEAGYVSIRALKALVPRHGITKRGDASGHVEADLLLYRRNGAVGKMFDALLKELTSN